MEITPEKLEFHGEYQRNENDSKTVSATVPHYPHTLATPNIAIVAPLAPPSQSHALGNVTTALFAEKTQTAARQ